MEGVVGKPKKRVRKPRTEHTRNLDVEKKRLNRQQVKMLQSRLWDLALQAQKRDNPEAAASRDSQQTLLSLAVEVVKGIRIRELRSLQVAGDAIRRGLMQSTTLGVLYVCIEDWTVRCSSKAMEIVCPWEVLRGYVGHKLCLLVHPDDHAQLRMFEEQARSFTPGAYMALSVRLLRACPDSGTLVLRYERQILEVTHVGPDQEHGGKLHALFTCVLEPASLQPLKFDMYERVRFQINANAVSGSMAIDCPRTTENLVTLSAILRDEGVNCTNDSHVADFLSGVSGRFRGSFGFSEMARWVQDFAMSALSGVVRTHVMFGVAPDGVPWVQKSAALQAFGLVSRFRTYVRSPMSGNSVNPVGETRNGAFGVLLSSPNEIGFVTLAFLEKGHGRSLWLVHRGVWVNGMGCGVTGQDEILMAKEHEVRPRRYVTNSTRIGPPLPSLVEEFCTFGEKAFSIPIGLQGLSSDQEGAAHAHQPPGAC